MAGIIGWILCVIVGMIADMKKIDWPIFYFWLGVLAGYCLFKL